MILFIIEGERRECELINAVCKLFFSNEKSQRVIFLYCGNIYNLYRDIKRISDEGLEYTTFGLLRERARKLNIQVDLHSLAESDVSEIYLFFDYDLHHTDKQKKLTMDEKNAEVRELLEFFSDETDNGKLFISYPMIEALRYTKQLPDENFHSYKIALSDVAEFKRLSAEFSYYQDLKFVTPKGNDLLKTEEIVTNWRMLILQHIDKVNELCTGKRGIPNEIESVSQRKIFEAQIPMQYQPNFSMIVLCSLPLFVFEYFGLKILPLNNSKKKICL